MAGRNVAINNLQPGLFDTDRLTGGQAQAARASNRAVDDVRAEQLARIPAGRFGDAEEFGPAPAPFFAASTQAISPGSRCSSTAGSTPGPSDAVPLMPGAAGEAEVARRTDHYFRRTRRIVEAHGDVRATYAVFMRRPVIFCPRLAVAWLEDVASARGIDIRIEPCFEEGAWVGSGEPLLYIAGPLAALVELETLYLQKLGPPCVAAYNAFGMCADLPRVAFLAMDARHCAGAEMAEMMAYAASVGVGEGASRGGSRGLRRRRQ